jgi:hypothetical protein
MRIPPYWAKEEYTGPGRNGIQQTFTATGWSFRSQAEAIENAQERARRISENLRRDEEPGDYEYLDRPLREEIVDSLDRGGEEVAKITRNRYGALVLNTARVCFADVDFPPPQYHGFFDAILSLFSSKRRNQRLKEGREGTFQSVCEWSKNHPDRGFRLYRTRAGLRLLFTDRLYDPTDGETLKMLHDLGSDSLYRKLTEKQECFRARLTPKPWRCGCDRPPNGYPWADEEQERIYREWQRHYDQETAPYATCRFVEALGDQRFADEIGEIIEIHDRFACGKEQTELA